MERLQKFCRSLLPLLLVAGLVWLIFGPVLGFGFINYDDDFTVNNPNLHEWFQWGWRKRLQTPHVGYPMPLPVAVWAVLKTNVSPERYESVAHAANLVLHSLNSMLLLVLLRRARVQVSIASFAAAVWALHPINVEPVVWATGLKEVLLATGFLIAALGWCDLVRGGRCGWIWLGLGSLVAFGAKPTAVVLWPLLLVLTAGQKVRESSWKPRPLLACAATLSVMSGLYGYHVRGIHNDFGGQGSPLPVVDRVVAAWSLHVEHLILPLDLRLVYQYEPPGLQDYFATGCTLALVVAALAWSIKRRRGLVFGGIMWSLATYVPYSGIAEQARFTADSYMYLPLIGLVTAGAGALTGWAPSWRGKAAGSMFVLVLAALTFAETADWRERGKRLWQECLLANPTQPFFSMKLGESFFHEGDYAEAIKAFEAGDTRHYGRTISFPPSWPQSYCELGKIQTCEDLYVEGLLRVRGQRANSVIAQRDLHFLELAYRLFRERFHRPVDPRLR